MKKPGEGDHSRDEGSGLYSIFRDSKSTPINSAHHDSPISRRPRKQTGIRKTTTSNNSTSGAFVTWPRKRSMQIVLNSGDDSAKKPSQPLKVRIEEEESSHNQSSLFEFGNEGSKCTYESESFVTRRKPILLLEPCSTGIPVDALATYRSYSNRHLVHNGSPFVSTAKANEVFEEHAHTAGPFDAHRHFEFNSPFNTLSPDGRQPYLLKTVEKPQVANVAYRSISSEVLRVLVSEMSSQEFLLRFILVDCRYPFEYEGGHIKHAVNLYDPLQIESVFYPKDEKLFAAVNDKIPIFYCEFSQKRGPHMAMQLRKCDRGQSAERWPHIDYKEIYILDRGYREFFCKFKELCEPMHYVPMKHPSYTAQLGRYDHHKKRTERNMVRMRGDDSLGLQWDDTPSSRPPLS